MDDPRENESKTVEGEFGEYVNTRRPDPLKDGDGTDHIEPGEPIAGPQGE